MVQDAWGNIQIDGHPRLNALLASVRTTYPEDFNGFMTNSYVHIAYSGLEEGAGATTSRHRKIAEILTDDSDGDKVVVMSDGVVEELNTPTNLLSNEHSLFYSLAKEAKLI